MKTSRKLMIEILPQANPGVQAGENCGSERSED